MKALPLPKSIYDTAKSLGVGTIRLEFSGGSDEGYLNVSFLPSEVNNDTVGNFRSDVEDWAWGVYDYSGSGDGESYGDTIIYDLNNGKVITSEWHMEPVESEPNTETLQFGGYRDL